MNYKEAYKLAEEKNKTLTSYDFGYGSIVYVLHQDGTSLTFLNALAYKDKQWCDWYFVFTEHCGFHVFSKDDLSDIRYFKESEDIEKLRE